MLRQFRKHDFLIALVGHKNVTRRFYHISRQGTQWCHGCTIAQHFVTKGTTGLARIAKDTGAGFILDQSIIISLDDLEIFGLVDTELHGTTGHFPTLATMTPTSKLRRTGNLSFKATTKARPSVSGRRHDVANVLRIRMRNENMSVKTDDAMNETRDNTVT
jgi:hypothetical protein